MPISVTSRAKALRASFALAALVALSPSIARAESAYIPQMASGTAVPLQAAATLLNAPPAPAVSRTPTAYTPPQTPEMAAMRGSGHNLAQTLQVGINNQALHVQAGFNNESTVGMIGSRNRAGVLQAGDNLRSNVVLLGTQGLNVGVIQPQGSAPINMLIARLPNGGLLIKR
ncbi:hypothetical protein [Methylobacterium brachythecii]|uniref:Minor curlin subunit n=1 Tax=Methylobacterium brachythecii TaxID=1176177 RepID=A0A7W6AJB4_9HYPH|nr:hypothetical protein [Methylobacterium brachythecii]MBB3904435.1 hypothetical protein [Methylobacterium brachythecii]GLS43634.1 hypothetical protein GCM10007884_16190 [Methylobacterium brachythecii]